MTEADFVGKSIKELRHLLAGKQVQAREITQAHLNRLTRVESQVDAFITVTSDLALRQADAVDVMVAKGEPLPPLAGIPIALKDNICLPGYPTTCGSRMLEHFVPPYSATVTERLFAGGAVCVGKTNLDEFAMGSSTEHSAFKQTKNPWDTSKVPGGSSGGSAASVACGSSVVAFGSDTGGSIRQPASMCGVVGMKPTYGVVSRFGLVAHASSLDQIGPLGRSVEDVAIALNVISGHDPRDATSSAARHPDFVQSLNKGVKGLRVGIMQELTGSGIDDDVLSATSDAVAVLKALGASVEEVSMPLLKQALPIYYLIATAEASSNLGRYDGVKYGYRDEESSDLLAMYFQSRKHFGTEVKRRIMLGTYALSSGYYDAYYKKAQQVRRLIKEEFDKEFKKFDILVSPVSPTVAFGIGQKTKDPLSMYLSDIASIPINLAGLPSISVPCGFGKGNLPIGLQIAGPTLSDAVVLAAAHAFEQATNWHKTTAPLVR